MKVRITNEFKNTVTVAQMPTVRRLVEMMKEDEMPLEGYIKIALDAISNVSLSSVEIYRPTAQVAKNARVSDRYFDGSGQFDVWIEFLAFDRCEGAFDCGVYLSDIWDLTEENKHLLKTLMYGNLFTKH